MKKFIPVLFLVVACCFLTACEIDKAPAVSPVISYNTAAPSLTPSSSPIHKEEYDYEDIENLRSVIKSYYSYAIEEADKYRTKVGDTEYYLDTDKLVEMDVDPEFPLYRVKEAAWPEYLGTTGFAFQVFGDYIYVQSDSLQEDIPNGTLTRVVNLNDLSVTPFDRNVNLFVPEQGSNIFYTYSFDDNIYIAEPSLNKAKKLHIEVPEQDIIVEKAGEYIDDICEYISVTEVKDGWIYFDYNAFIYEGESLHEGNYRIKTDGSRIEKTDESHRQVTE